MKYVAMFQILVAQMHRRPWRKTLELSVQRLWCISRAKVMM